MAWSKGGTIASISPDGRSLELRYLRASPQDATWELSEPKVIAPWENLNGGPLVHLSWGPANSELAVIDAVGRVLLLSFNNELNRPHISRRWTGDAVDDLHTIVGTYWLNQLPSNSRVQPLLLDVRVFSSNMMFSSIQHIPLQSKTQKGPAIHSRILEL